MYFFSSQPSILNKTLVSLIEQERKMSGLGLFVSGGGASVLVFFLLVLFVVAIALLVAFLVAKGDDVPPPPTFPDGYTNTDKSSVISQSSESEGTCMCHTYSRFGLCVFVVLQVQDSIFKTKMEVSSIWNGFPVGRPVPSCRSCSRHRPQGSQRLETQ